jgi:acyl carrier protein
MNTAELEQRIQTIIMEEFFANEDASLLTPSTALLTEGILDSIATLNLVGLLEEDFGISIEAHEVNTDNFNSIVDIARLIQSKV